jgi:hypothetical protein
MPRRALVLLAACGHAAPAPAPAACAAVHSLTPIGGYFDGARVHTGLYWTCELPDRVVLVSQTMPPVTGEAVSIPRTSPAQLRRAPLAPASACTDPCDHDGYAGCSLKETCTLASPIATITTGVPSDSPFGVVRSVDGVACAAADGVIASCDTPAHAVTVRAAACGRFTATLDGRALDATAKGNHFSFGDATLTFDPAGSLTVNGRREPCDAFALSSF